MPALPEFNDIRDKNIFQSIMQDKFARIAFFVLLFLYISVFLASFISPYPKDYSNRNKAYAPPSKIYIINEKGRLCAPYTYNYIRSFNSRKLNQDGNQVFCKVQKI